MAALAGIKLDEDGTASFPSNCFPVRSFLHREEDGDGAWFVSHRAEQRRRFKAILCTKPRTYSRIKEERKKSENEGKTLNECNFEEDEEEAPVLDGFFLMKHCCVDDPSDLCSINISGKGFSEVKEEDLALFDNVAYVNAAENLVPFEAFRGFPILRELEVPLNGLRSLKFSHTDYPSLELLDLSFNNLSQEDILILGTLPRLKVLHLTGNSFHNLPLEFCLPFTPEGHKSQYPRFPYLEVLMLDDNKLSDINIFAAIAGLQKLKHLNLEKNEIYFVPQLKSVQGQMELGEHLAAPTKKRKTPRSGRSSRRSKSQQSANSKKSREITPDSLGSWEIINSSSLPDEATLTAGAEVKNSNEEENKQSEGKDKLNEGENKEEPTNIGVESQDGKNELLEEFDFSLGDLSARINELKQDVDTGSARTSRKQDVEPTSKIAFPELRFLSLAYNKISNEEALLAVAAWPMLTELVIHDNPLTTENVGDPPLLKRFLCDRLGIKLVRKRVPPVVKNIIEMPDRRSRKVKTQVPKIPRPTVEQRLMLEAPKPQPVLQTEERPSTTGYKSPLPPINTHRDRAASASGLPRKPEEDDMSDTRPSEAWSSDYEPELDADTFFMTQVEDQVEEKMDKKPKKKKKPELRLDSKYQGFEALFDDVDGEEDFIEEEMSNDIQSNVRALRYALNHQLIYRDTKSLQLDAVHKQVKPYRRAPQPPPAPKPSKQEKIEKIVENLRDRNTIDESSLQNVLKNKKMLRQFPEAETLLAQIQHRYNAVRVNSMKEAKDARKVVQDTIGSISSAGKRTVRS